MGSEARTRLVRRIGLLDAVVLGLGAMLGAGVFSAFAPAAGAAGSWLLVGLAVAALVAYCNATSSARLAAQYPESGGTYAYGRHRLGPLPGFLAGWSFTAGKLASCAAIALTFGAYVSPGAARLLGIAAVVVLTGVNLAGISKTAAVTRAIVALVLGALALFVAGALTGGTVDAARLDPPEGLSVMDVLQAGAFLFFAFAGYARIATLGEEVVDPSRTIPRAIPIALGIALTAYVGVGLAAVLAASPQLIAASPAPLEDVLRAGDAAGLAPFVGAGAAIASLGVLLSLLVGVSRTAFAMAANGDLPRRLADVHPTRRVPHVAELAAAAVVVALVAVADLRGAIGFSSFCVLLYYAITNASALTLRDSRGGTALAVAGLVGCVALAVAVPVRSLVGGAAVVAVGLVGFALRRAFHR